MGNWFRTVISAPEHVIKAMINAENHIDFQKILPIDEEWGTPTNAYESKYDLNKGIARFDTKYSCPYEILIEISKRFPDDIICIISECDVGDDWRIFGLLNGQIVPKKVESEGPYSWPTLWNYENHELVCLYWESKLKGMLND